jgi:hypothetical protein
VATNGKSEAMKITYTYKPNSSGKSYAVMAGRIRFGYISEGSKAGTWLYWTNVLRPEGGSYMGKCKTILEAKTAIEASFENWLDLAFSEPLDAPPKEGA